MKRYATSTLVGLLMAAGVLDLRADEGDPKSISAESLNTLKVIGKLGVPLGKVATVRAIVVDGDTLTKSEASSYLLKITEVDGRKLDPAPMLKFSRAPGSDVKLANDHFDLHRLKTGGKAGKLTSEQVENLKKDYVGKAFLLQVYELGEFTGIPEDFPDEVAVWQDSGFHFRTYLRVLREVDAK